MTDDDDPKRDDARLANEARVAGTALRKAREDREAFWDRQGFNVRDGAPGSDDLKDTLAWARRAKDRSALLGKRVMQWVSAIGAVITVFGVLLDIYLKVKGVK